MVHQRLILLHHPLPYHIKLKDLSNKVDYREEAASILDSLGDLVSKFSDGPAGIVED